MFGLMLKSTHDEAVKDKSGVIANRDGTIAALHDQLAAEKHRAQTSGRALSEMLTERDAAHKALDEIAALETPSCASIGKRMAKLARDARGEG